MDATPSRIPPRPAEPPGPGGGRSTTPAQRPGRVRAALGRLAESAWAPVAAKAAAILLGMIALAGIGAASIARGSGVPVAAAAPTPRAGHEGWIAPERPTPAGAQSAPPGPAPAGERPAAPKPGASAAPPAPASPGITPDGKVVLNLATAADLTLLPKVGPKRAREILEVRRRLGKFKKPTDLLRVRGIGRKTLQQMLPRIVVDPPPEPAPPTAPSAG